MTCRNGARWVLNAIAALVNEKLAVYIVWIPVWEGDMAAKAERARLQLGDAPVREFFTRDPQLPLAFRDALSWGTADRPHASGDVPWDVHLVYPDDALWNDAPTAPAHWASPCVKDPDLHNRIAAVLDQTR